MINYHPSEAVLKEFVAGTLPASVAIVVASHVEMCDECQSLVSQLTAQVAMEVFDVQEETLNIEDFDFNFDESELEVESLETQSFNAQLFETQPQSVASLDMLEAITAQPVEKTATLPVTVKEIEVSGTRVALPRAMKSISLKEWQGIGKISRARLNLDDDERRMSLLHIAKGGNVPQHTHKGYEITLLLEGSFEDEMGSYHAGDFIWLDGKHTHNPMTQEGCVCLTVSSDALRFTQGVSQLINPLGKLIY
ncbi:ChrR family anti-sigma-E factor [Vibrio algarum]|uniref:ChrR family anti-sigma-E factor n=1 Tax=Vibrio algarum TaxID=3020714 RepID=A0ABT4YVJ4_9VIBR|nr:ChrR family anti-sigma-E factor [Vibrio sp. KJ40-1]MDB1125604.1 ChrR family anti-sigma-E factor [Vibrio sp. KJ40-1]